MINLSRAEWLLIVEALANAARWHEDKSYAVKDLDGRDYHRGKSSAMREAVSRLDAARSAAALTAGQDK